MSAALTPTGWPLGRPDDNGRLAFSRGEDALREALWNLLLTSPGERLMRPDFGAGLRAFLDQPNTESTRQLMAGAVRQAITRFEPRIVLLDVSVDADPSSPAQAVVSVTYVPRSAQAGPPLRLTLSLGRG